MPIKLKDRENLNKKKTEELKKAFTLDGNGQPVNFHWKEDQATKFIDYIKDESNGLLSKFRVIPMNAPTKEIAKIIDEGKFLRPSGEYARTGGNGKEGYKFGTDKIKLVTKKIEGKVYISDDELADNIEGSNWEDHVKQMVAKKIANEIVDSAIYGRALENPNGENGILNVFNGLKYSIKKSGNVIDLKDASSREIDRKKIISAKKVLKNKYRTEVEMLMDSDIKTDLDELYNDPNGNRGNGETIKNSVSGININEVPLMKSDNAVKSDSVTTLSVGVNDANQKTINVSSDLTSKLNTGDSIIVRPGEADEIVYSVAGVNSGAIVVLENLIYDIPADSTIAKAELNGSDIILTNPKNVIVGIQKDVTVEFERLAPDGFNIWYTMRQDIIIENPEATVLIENLKTKDY